MKDLQRFEVGCNLQRLFPERLLNKTQRLSEFLLNCAFFFFFPITLMELQATYEHHHHSVTLTQDHSQHSANFKQMWKLGIREGTHFCRLMLR